MVGISSVRPSENRMRKHIVNDRGFPNAFVQKHDEKALIKSHK